MVKEILTKKCPYCGKEFVSLYERQLEYNYQSHLLSCNKLNFEEKKEETKNGI